MTDLRVTAEALLKTAQIYQRNFEVVSAQLQTLRQRQIDSDQRFELMLAELRQLKIDSDARFNQIFNRLPEQQNGE